MSPACKQVLDAYNTYPTIPNSQQLATQMRLKPITVENRIRYLMAHLSEFYKGQIHNTTQAVVLWHIGHMFNEIVEIDKDTPRLSDSQLLDYYRKHGRLPGDDDIPPLDRDPYSDSDETIRVFLGTNNHHKYNPSRRHLTEEEKKHLEEVRRGLRRIDPDK